MIFWTNLFWVKMCCCSHALDSHLRPSILRLRRRPILFGWLFRLLNLNFFKFLWIIFKFNDLFLLDFLFFSLHFCFIILIFIIFWIKINHKFSIRIILRFFLFLTYRITYQIIFRRQFLQFRYVKCLIIEHGSWLIHLEAFFDLFIFGFFRNMNHIRHVYLAWLYQVIVLNVFYYDLYSIVDFY